METNQSFGSNPNMILTRQNCGQRSSIALRTPDQRLPSGALKEEFGRMIFQKKSSLGHRTKVPRQLLVEVRRGIGTCDAPCTLDHHCSSASLYHV